MSKHAKVLIKVEIKGVVAVIKNSAHADRNLTAFYLSLPLTVLHVFPTL